MDYKKFLEDPILDRFRQVAPGSFKHCQRVSTMCEEVALELGLNPDLMKLCGMVHDIGKMHFPLHFSENQGKENIHDTLEPNVSYHFITRHVPDGVLLLLQNEFPIEVINIISEHHGDTILRQFHKNDSTAPEDNYRYKCNKPSSTEAVVLMIVDSVEATSRAMFIKQQDGEGNGNFVKRVIRETIDRLDEDDQLDQILHGTIKKIKLILTRELESEYHKRVDYDDDDEKKEEN